MEQQIVGKENLTTDQVKKLVIGEMKYMKHFDFDVTNIVPKTFSHEFAGNVGQVIM